MNERSSPVTSSSYTRILIAEDNFSTLEALLNTFGDRRLDIDFDLCTSHKSALLKLLRSPYQLIIGGVHLAEMDEFYLPRRKLAYQPLVPLVITASPLHKESARLVLGQGAFDVIPMPIDHEQTVSTIRLALWQSKLMQLIAQKEKALEKYRQHLDAFPGNRKMDEAFDKALLSVQKTVASFERTIQRIEESIKCFADLAKCVEQQTRECAIERLDTWCQPGSKTA